MSDKLALIDSLIATIETNIHQPPQVENNQNTTHNNRNDNIEEQKRQSQTNCMDMVQQLDHKLRFYYQKHDKDYSWNDTDHKGIFAKWCEDEEYFDSNLRDEFDGDAKDAVIIDFDPNFPLRQIYDEQERNDKIFKILKHMYESIGKEIFVDEFDVNVTATQIKETFRKYEKHLKTWGNDSSFTQLTDINILYYLTVSRVGNPNNLVLNLIDSYRRDNIADLIKIKLEMDEKGNDLAESYEKILTDEERIKKWIEDRPFLKQLNEKIKATRLDFEDVNAVLGHQKHTNTKHAKHELDLKNLIQTYPRRFTPGLQLCDRLINDNLETVSKWIVSTSKFVELLLTQETKGIGGPPCLIDFIILLEPSVRNNDTFEKDIGNTGSDDEFDEIEDLFTEVDDSEKNVDIVGDFIAHLQANKCAMSHKKYCDITEEDNKDLFDLITRKTMHIAFRDLVEKITNKNKTYPQGRRFNVIIDRRDYYNDQKENKENTEGKDMVILFEPPADCNRLSDVKIPECYFDLSRRCLIPRPGYGEKRSATSDPEVTRLKQETITSTTTSQGQILTLSYHIWEAEEIKCYLLWHGQTHRFYPQDILEILPHIFRKDKANEEFVKSDRAKKLIMEMYLNDEQFEMFYRTVNGWTTQEYKFPKRYASKFSH